MSFPFDGEWLVRHSSSHRPVAYVFRTARCGVYVLSLYWDDPTLLFVAEDEGGVKGLTWEEVEGLLKFNSVLSLASSDWAGPEFGWQNRKNGRAELWWEGSGEDKVDALCEMMVDLNAK